MNTSHSYMDYIADLSDEEFDNACYTLTQRKELLDQRLAIVYDSKKDLLEKKLNMYVAGSENSMIVKGTKLSKDKAKLVWVFLRVWDLNGGKWVGNYTIQNLCTER